MGSINNSVNVLYLLCLISYEHLQINFQRLHQEVKGKLHHGVRESKDVFSEMEENCFIDGLFYMLHFMSISTGY